MSSPRDGAKPSELERFIAPSDQTTVVALPAQPPKRIFVLPPGIELFRRLFRRNATTLGSLRFFQLYTLLATYLLYVCYHLSRKPFSITKNVLHRDNCSDYTEFLADNPSANISPAVYCSWRPFEDPDKYKSLYGWLDLSYWLAYAIVMFFVGGIADRSNLRHFVCAGMLMAGFWTVAFGMAYVWEIHAVSYFIVVQIVCGIFQATGWPVMVALVGNWFGKGKRGLIFGIWNSHSSIGNILGSAIASAFVEKSWALSFIVPGVIIIVGGILALFFVIVRPEDAGFESQNNDNAPPPSPHKNGQTKEEIHLNEKNSGANLVERTTDAAAPPPDDKAVNFLSAFMIPGVIEFAACLFFSKAVSYVFLLWLPKFIKDTSAFGSAAAGYISIVYDLGGITGGIIAGGVSDYLGSRGIVAFAFAMLGGPILWIVLNFANTSMPALFSLLFCAGITVVGPYALITTAVSADLGSSLKGQAKALATVTGIINGCGSFGSALGPLFVGLILHHGWATVFYCLMAAQLLAALCLSRVVFREVVAFIRRRRNGGAAAP